MLSAYLTLPFATWLVTGIIKFAVNCIKEKRLAFDLIGYGGMPSNHSAVVSSMSCYIGLNEGINSPSFGIALTLSFIVILDANGLRQKISQHATHLNKHLPSESPLRERIGHNKAEIIVGILVGLLCAFLSHLAFSSQLWYVAC